MAPSLKSLISHLYEAHWRPFVGKDGKPVENQSVHGISHCIGKYEKSFTLVIQRQKIQGQAELDLDADTDAIEVASEGYIYRAIAIHRDDWNDSQIVHWYNQRAEDSENRIKEVKLDFGGDTLPCSDFKANGFYFLLSALSYNLFALMRQLLPEALAHHSASTLRWRLYAVAAKVVKTGRPIHVKLQTKNKALLESVLSLIKAFAPPPI